MSVGGEAWAVRFLMLQSLAQASLTVLDYLGVSNEIVNILRLIMATCCSVERSSRAGILRDPSGYLACILRWIFILRLFESIYTCEVMMNKHERTYQNYRDSGQSSKLGWEIHPLRCNMKAWLSSARSV